MNAIADDDPAGLAARITDNAVACIMTEALFLSDNELRETLMPRLHATILSAVLTYAVLTSEPHIGCGGQSPSTS